MKNYAAYGSNLNIGQMAYRCPGAKLLGTAWLEDWQLLFKGSKTGSYLTVEPKKGFRVPIGIWQVNEANESQLDIYEGYPTFYQKFEKPVKVCLTDGTTKRMKIFFYAMPTSAKLGMPTERYLITCCDGYEDFGFDLVYLEEALLASRRTK